MENIDEYIQKQLNKAEILGLNHISIRAIPDDTNIHIIISKDDKSATMLIPSNVTGIGTLNKKGKQIRFFNRTDYEYRMLYDVEVLKLVGGSGIKSAYNIFLGIDSDWVHIKELDVSRLDTSNMTNMRKMFADCTDYTKVVGIENFDTHKVVDMRAMFEGYNIGDNELNLKNFNTSKVKDMSNMFYGMRGKIVGIENFDTSSVTNMCSMFESAEILSDLILHFDTSNVKSMEEMFKRAIIKGTLDISTFKVDENTNMFMMFEAATSTPLSLELLKYIEGEVLGMNNVIITDENIQRSYNKAARLSKDAVASIKRYTGIDLCK